MSKSQMEDTGKSSRKAMKTKQAEERRFQRERSELVRRDVPFGVFDWDLRTGEIFATGETEALYGLSPGELGRDLREWENRVHPDDLSMVQARLREYMSRRKDFHIEFRIIRPDGAVRWIAAMGRPVHDAQGHPLRMVGLHMDVTGSSYQRRGEEALEQSESYYRQTVNSLPSLVWTCRPDGYCDFFSEQWTAFTGSPMTEYLGDRWTEALHPEDREKAFVMWREAVEERGTYDLVYRVRGRNGLYRWFKTRGRPIRDDKGQIVRWFGTCTDIHEQIVAEEKLRESERRFRLLAEASFEGVVISGDGVIRDANSQFAGMLGYTVDEVIDKDASELIAPEDRDRVLANIRHGLASSLEHEMVCKDGSRIIVEAHGRSIDGKEGMLRITALRDVTERKRTEQALKDLNENLEVIIAQRTALAERRARQLQALAMQLADVEERERQRLAEILHDDLQQLLVGAKLHLDLLAHRANSNCSLGGLITQIKNLLDESIEKSRTMSHELNPPTLRQQGLISALRWLCRRMKTKYGLEVKLQASPDAEPLSESLKIFLYRAAQEMLFNIVKHAGVKAALVAATKSGEKVMISVSDNGKGFNADDAYGLVENYSGFGLFSIQERASLMGGGLLIDTAPGKGSLLTLSVPVDGMYEVSGAGRGGAPSLAGAGEKVERENPGGTRPIRVLLVDDHQVVREGMTALLEDSHDMMIVGEADNGRVALELVDAHRPDVVVMDVSMPVMNGVEATRIIKRKWPDTRVIGLSMFQEEDMAREMLAVGAEAYLSKSGPSRELIEKIRGGRH